VVALSERVGAGDDSPPRPCRRATSRRRAARPSANQQMLWTLSGSSLLVGRDLSCAITDAGRYGYVCG
jgi:hypothetical protein